MKVRTDVSNGVQGGWIPVSQNTNPPVEQKNTRNSENQLASNAKIKDYNDAMVVMQKAQMIVQQAINVSGQLRNIAASTIMTGKADYSRIGTELNKIDNSIKEFGLNPGPEVQVKKPDRNINLTPVKNAITVLNDMMKSGNYDEKIIKTTTSELKNFEKEIIKKIDTVSKEAGVRENVNSGQLSRNITQNPGEAIAAQGYINPAAVKTLIS